MSNFVSSIKSADVLAPDPLCMGQKGLAFEGLMCYVSFNDKYVFM